MDHPTKVSQFGLVCLNNVIIKVVSKIIANRLKPLMKDLVGEWQSSFIPGRQTVDNMVIAQEILHSLHKKKGAKKSMMIKIDLEKAYARINWGFLKEVIEVLGFNKKTQQYYYELLDYIKTFNFM